MTLAIGRQQAPGGLEGASLAQAGQRVEESALPGCGRAHVARGHDRNAAGLGHLRGVPREALDPAVEKPRDVDAELRAEDVPSAIQQGGVEPLVAPQQHAPLAGLGLELVPGESDSLAGARIARLQRFVAAGVGAAEEPADSSPALGRLDEQSQSIGKRRVQGRVLGSMRAPFRRLQRADGNLGPHQRAQARGLCGPMEAG
jgi:hypothetical protein